MLSFILLGTLSRSVDMLTLAGTTETTVIMIIVKKKIQTRVKNISKKCNAM